MFQIWYKMFQRFYWIFLFMANLRVMIFLTLPLFFSLGYQMYQWFSKFHLCLMLYHDSRKGKKLNIMTSGGEQKISNGGRAKKIRAPTTRICRSPCEKAGCVHGLLHIISNIIYRKSKYANWCASLKVFQSCIF